MKFTDATTLRRELEAGYANQREANNVRKAILRSYESKAFGAKGDSQPENRVYSYVTRMTPKLIADNPQVDVTHAGGFEERKTAAVLTAGMNEWISQTKHYRLLQRMVPYVLTGWGITLTTLQKIGGWNDNEDEVTSPNVIVIDPSDCTWDPYAASWETKRWCSHKYARDQEELLGWAKAHPEEKWDVKAIEACAVDSGLDELSRSTVATNVPKRKEVVLQDVWCAGEGDSSGYLYTIGVNSNGNGEFLREVRDFYGPRSGPYTLWGVYSTPMRSLPMSPLGAVWPMIEELNAYANVISESARRGKSVAISGLPSTQTSLIQNAKDFETVLVPGYKSGENFEVAQFGYVTRERMEYMALLGDRVDRILGMDDNDRGKVTGIGTATEVATAAHATGEITGYVAQRFLECAEECEFGVLWYLYHADTVTFDIPLDEEDRKEKNIDRMTFRGGAAEGDKFDGYVLEIEQYSMQRMSEAKLRQRSNDLLQLFQMLPLIGQVAPFADVEGLLDEIGTGLSIPDLGGLVSGDKGAEVFNANMNMQQQQATGEAPMAQQSPAQPSQSSEVFGSEARNAVAGAA